MTSTRTRIIVLLTLSCIIGFLHLLPHYLFRAKLGNQYQHIMIMYSADEGTYSVRLKNSLDGAYNIKNPYLYEHKYSSIPKFTFTAENLLGSWGRIFNLSLENLILLMRFILPMVAFLLMFALFSSLARDRAKPSPNFYWCLVFPLLALLVPHWIYAQIDFLNRPVFDFLLRRGVPLLWYEQYLQSPLPFSRLINPQFSGLFFIGALVALISFLHQRRWLLSFLLFAIFLYLNFRFYYYFWSSLGSFLLVALLVALFYKERRIWIPLAGLIIIALILARPYIIKALYQVPERYAALYTYTLSHRPILSPGCIVAIILLIIFVLAKRYSQLNVADSIIILGSLVTVLITMNQQLLTGKIVQPWHYELFTTPLLISIALFLLIIRTDYLKNFEQWLQHKLITKVSICILIVTALLILLYFQGVMSFLYYFQLAPRMTEAFRISIFLSLIGLVFFTGLICYILLLSTKSVGETLRHSVLAIVIIFVVLMESGERQTYVALSYAPYYEKLQSLSAAFHWLNKMAPKDSVVLASVRNSEIIPRYTHCAVYLSKDAVHFGRIPDRERRQRLIDYFRFLGASVEKINTIVRQWPYHYILWGLRKFDTTSDLYSFGQRKPLTEQEIEDFLSEYKRNWVEPPMPSYKLNYILYGVNERQEFGPAHVSSSFRKVYDDGHTCIYQLPRDRKE